MFFAWASGLKTGLFIFDTDTGSFWFYNGTAWTNLAGGGGTPATCIADTDGNTKVQTGKNPNEDVIRFDLGGTEYMAMRRNTTGTARLERLKKQAAENAALRAQVEALGAQLEAQAALLKKVAAALHPAGIVEGF